MPTQRRLEKMQRVIKNRQQDLTVVCENIYDPHNVSAILRSCDAVGVEKIHLYYTHGHRFPELGKQSSGSAKKWIDTERHSTGDSLRNTLKDDGFTIYATALEMEAKPIHDIDWTKPSAIIVGNEHNGVSPEALEIADEVIYVPMFGMIQSLNVSVATAVILYEACRQRILQESYPNPNLSEEQRAAILADWIER